MMLLAIQHQISHGSELMERHFRRLTAALPSGYSYIMLITNRAYSGMEWLVQAVWLHSEGQNSIHSGNGWLLIAICGV